MIRGGATVRVAVVVAGALVLAVVGTPAGAGAAAPRPPVRVLPDLPASAEDLRAPRASNSPLLVADPTDPRFVVLAHRLDAPDFSCALEVSGDGGRGWIPAVPVPKLPEGAEKCYAPEVAFDADGKLYYLFVGLHGVGNSPMGVFLTTSSNQGRTFSAPRRILESENYQVRMAIDRTMGDKGRLHLVWLHSTQSAPLGGLPPPPNPILSAYSDDGGATFSKPVQISDPERPLAVAGALTLGPDHAVHVAYYDLQDDLVDYEGLEGGTWTGDWSVVSVSSYDGGAHWQRSVLIDDALVPPERVMLIYTMPPPAVVADRAGRVFVAWHDARNGDWDVFVSRSANGGRSWSLPRRLNDDPMGNGKAQSLPHLSVAADGRLDAVFYDRRLDARNIANDVYYTYSADGGRTFTANVRLSSRSFDSRVGARYLVPSAKDMVDYGSRIAVLAREEGAVAAWTDTRNSIGGTEQDIFATQVKISSRGGGGFPWLVVPLGVVLLLAGLLLLRRGRSRRSAELRPGETA